MSAPAWRGGPARVHLSQEGRAAIAAYSPVGGLLRLVCSFFYPIFLAAAVDLQLNPKGRLGEKLAVMISTV